MEEKVFSDFIVDDALAGRTLYVTKLEGSDYVVTNDIVTDFQKASASAVLPYQANVSGRITLFNTNGISRDSIYRLVIANNPINTEADQSKGDTIAVTRSVGDTEETVHYTLTTLNYREQVAARMCQAFIGQMPSPLSYDDAKIKTMVAKAFLIAAEFMNQAATRRNTDSTSAGGDAVDVNANTLTSNTDKILYNINENLKNGIAVKGETVELGGVATPIRIQNSDIKLYVPTVDEDIAIKVSVFKGKTLLFRFTNEFAYTDISIYAELTVKENTVNSIRKVGFILPKGTVTSIQYLDADVTEIVTIDNISVRGQGINDTNTYTISVETT